MGLKVPFGLRPVTTLGSSSSARMGKYPKAAGSTANNQLVVGDVVYLNADGQAVRVNASTGAVQGRIIGVVAGFASANGVPNVFAKPTGSGKVATSAATGYVLVYDDPDQVYQVNVDTTANFEAIVASGAGNLVDLVVTENDYDLVLGRSGTTIQATAASAAAAHAVVIGASTEVENGTYGTAIIKLKNHILG